MNKIREIRERKGIRQLDFAEALGVSKQYICNLENSSKKSLSLKQAIKIADFLNVSLDELVGRQDGQAETHKNY